MDQKDRARHSVAETRSHLALVAEELARRASFDWVKKQAKAAASDKAHDAAREARLHPVITSAVAAGIGAAAIFAIVRKRSRAKTVATAYYHQLPARHLDPSFTHAAGHLSGRVAKEVKRRAHTVADRAPELADQALGLLRESGREALYALRGAYQRQIWLDRLAPVIGGVVVLASIALAIADRRSANRAAELAPGSTAYQTVDLDLASPPTQIGGRY